SVPHSLDGQLASLRQPDLLRARVCGRDHGLYLQSVRALAGILDSSLQADKIVGEVGKSGELVSFGRRLRRGLGRGPLVEHQTLHSLRLPILVRSEFLAIVFAENRSLNGQSRRQHDRFVHRVRGDGTRLWAPAKSDLVTGPPPDSSAIPAAPYVLGCIRSHSRNPVQLNKQPRPEDMELGWPPRGGRSP